MIEKNFREELMVCMKEQGYYETWNFLGEERICFSLEDVISMEKILKTLITGSGKQ